MGITLYEVAGRYATLQELAFDFACDNGGEIPPDVAAVLSQSEDELNAKLDACCRVVANLSSASDACEHEAARLAAKARRLKEQCDRLKDYIKYNMETAGIQKVKPSPHFGLRICKSPPSVVVDPGIQLPRGFIKVVESADKAAIKDALQQGLSVPGCQLITTNTHLRID